MTIETTTASRVKCPSCRQRGRRVAPTTLRSLLKEEFATTVAPGNERGNEKSGCAAPDTETGWRFCNSSDCDVVYFSEKDETAFTKSQLKVPVGIKEKTGERPLCYCFGHSVASIKNELRTKGRSDALDEIRTKMKDPGCHCETANPSGACCLGQVTQGIRIAQEELEMTVSNLTSGSTAKSATGRGEKIARIGTLLSAVMASACCWLPLVLLAIGVSGAGIAATLHAYRPLFIVLTVGFLGAAFYFTYRPKKADSATGQGCCPPEPSEGEGCCASASNHRFPLKAVNKMMLWGVTIVATAFLFFPNYVGLFLGSRSTHAVVPSGQQVVIHIDGMTCEGCATTVAQALRRVEGVQSVSVSYAKRKAVVGVQQGKPIPKTELLTALKKAGYTGTLIAEEKTN